MRMNFTSEYKKKAAGQQSSVGVNDLHVHWPGRAGPSACSPGCDDAHSKCCPLEPRSLLLQPAGACAPLQQTDVHRSDIPAGDRYRKRGEEKKLF